MKASASSWNTPAKKEPIVQLSARRLDVMLDRLLKTKDGKMRRLEAKMIGMTPAWFTFSGRYWRVPPKTRRPRTCLADWVGIRRWLSVIAMTPTTTEMNRPRRRMIVRMLYLPGSAVSLEVEFTHRLLSATGSRA